MWLFIAGILTDPKDAAVSSNDHLMDIDISHSPSPSPITVFGCPCGLELMKKSLRPSQSLSSSLVHFPVYEYVVYMCVHMYTCVCARGQRSAASVVC